MSATKVAGFAIALALVGCGSPPSWSVQPSSSASEQELFAVRSCRSQMNSCVENATTSAQMQACQQAMHACLSALCREAGFGSGQDDGGSFQGSDDGGGFPGQGDDGGGFGPPGSGGHGGSCGGGQNGDDGGGSVSDDGGGQQPPVDEAGSGGQIPPVDDASTGGQPPVNSGSSSSSSSGSGSSSSSGSGMQGSGSQGSQGGSTAAVEACLEILLACLSSNVDPLTCATETETCLLAIK